MYGLEKDKKTPFEFDLEQELRKDPAQGKAKLQMIEERIQEIKNLLREGSASEEFDKLGVLLQGYTAAKKIINKITTKK